MIGCAMIALGSVLLFKAARRHRRWAFGYAGGGCGGPRQFRGHHHGHGGFHPYRDDGEGDRHEHHHRGDPRSWLARELRLTPEQEKVAYASWDEVREAAKKARGEFDRTRGDVEKAFGPDVFDAETLGNTYARHDELVDGVRVALTGALAKVHETLDPSQRRHLAGLLAGGWFRRFWAR